MDVGTSGGWVAIITAIAAGAVIILKQWQTGRGIAEVKAIVADPLTGLAATHAAANSGLSKTQAAAEKAVAEIERLNQAAADLAAKALVDTATLTATTLADTVRQAVAEAMAAYENRPSR